MTVEVILKTKDIITTGTYTALYFVFLSIGTGLAVLVEHNPNMKLAPAFTALLAGTVYMLLIAKVRKFGALTLMSAVLAVFFFMSGHFILSFLPSILCGFLADMVAKVGHYRHKIANLVSYMIFSFGNLSPILMMWFIRDAYIKSLMERGKDASYVARVMIDFNLGNLLYLALGIVLTSLIGGLFGQYMVRKHFAKAGMVSND